MNYTNVAELKTLMLHTKFQRNWPSGSEEEVLNIFEHDGNFGHANLTIHHENMSV